MQCILFLFDILGCTVAQAKETVRTIDNWLHLRLVAIIFFLKLLVEHTLLGNTLEFSFFCWIVSSLWVQEPRLSMETPEGKAEKISSVYLPIGENQRLPKVSSKLSREPSSDRLFLAFDLFFRIIFYPWMINKYEQKLKVDCQLGEGAVGWLQMINSQQMSNLSLIIRLSLLIVAQSLILTGTFNVSQSLLQFTYQTTSTALYVNFQLTLTPTYSAALLIGKGAPFTASVNREDWIHFRYMVENSCDYEGMVTGRAQYAFARYNGTNSTIYFKLINFEPLSPFSYSVTITEGNSFLQSCPVGLIKQTAGEYCQFCDFAHIGTYCSVARHTVNPSSSMNIILDQLSYNYFLLGSQAELSLNLMFDRGIMFFLQVQTDDYQMAGVTNYLSSSQGQGKYIYGAPVNVNIDLPSAWKGWLVGVINPHAAYVGFSIQYTQNEGVNIVIIIIGVMGGLFFLGLIIAAIFIIRRLNNNSRREVIPYGSILVERPRSNKLNQQQINFYFPQIALQTLEPQLQNSVIYFKQEKLQEKDKVECIICLCSIQDLETVRAGYCKHIFHSACLVQWFKKQQNCPYCRQNYEREATRQLYKKMTQKAGRKLKGEEIVKSIFARSNQISLNTINVTDISGQTYE